MIQSFDKLIKWANEQGYWAKYLLKVVFEKNEVSEYDLDFIIKRYAKNDIEDEFDFTMPNVKIEKIYLNKLYNVNGVNKLATNQSIEFTKNLTIIYGHNGSGKTGYSRILKSLGYSLDKNSIIYSNIFDSNQLPISATIEFTNSNEEVKTLIFTPNTSENINLKVFNSTCINYSLSSQKELLFQPQEFTILYILSESTKKLNAKIKKMLEHYSSQYNMAGIIDGTKTSLLLQQITRAKPNNFKEQINNFIEDNGYSIEEIEKKLLGLKEDNDNLNTKVLDVEKNKLIEIKNNLLSLQNYIYIKSGIYDNTFIETFISNSKKLLNLKQEKQTIDQFLKTVFSSEQKQALENFLLYADKFYHSIKDENISDMKNCIFCKQPIVKDETKELLLSYEKFINADNSEKINETEAELVALNNRINAFIENIEIHLNHINEGVIYDSLTMLKSNYNKFLNHNFSEKDFEETSLLDLDEFKKILTNEIEKINTDITDKNTKAEKILDLKKINQEKENELKSAKYLIEVKENFIENFTSYKNLFKIESISNNKLAVISKSLLDEKYKESYSNALNKYITLLEAPNYISFNPSISGANITLKQSLNNKEINSILSEGEQTVLSLAHFIAENLLLEEDNVLIFDDPVNSLDIQRIDIVAKNLVLLAREKQVIIFTHNLYFLSCLNSHYKKLALDEDISKNSYYVEKKSDTNGNELTGYISNEMPDQTYRYYESKIKSIICSTSQSGIGEQSIRNAYDWMRCAIEILISDIVLKGTVKRLEPDVKIGKFGEIKTDVLKEKQNILVNLYERACRYINGHSSSIHAVIPVTFSNLKSDFDELDNIKKLFS